ncbi:MAG: hypothetical protein U1F77_10305 [Kiritimatiellia bacterium]
MLRVTRNAAELATGIARGPVGFDFWLELQRASRPGRRGRTSRRYWRTSGSACASGRFLTVWRVPSAGRCTMCWTTCWGCAWGRFIPN